MVNTDGWRSEFSLRAQRLAVYRRSWSSETVAFTTGPLDFSSLCTSKDWSGHTARRHRGSVECRPKDCQPHPRVGSLDVLARRCETGATNEC